MPGRPGWRRGLLLLGAYISAKGGVNRGLTMVDPGEAMRACYCGRWCCRCPSPSPPHQSQTEVHVDGLGPRVVEGGPRRWDRDRIAALALVAFAVLTIVAMVMTLSLALAAITRGTRRSRGGAGVLMELNDYGGGTSMSGPSVSSSKTRSSQILWKDGNGVLHMMMAQR
jgi:hypothetical protein